MSSSTSEQTHATTTSSTSDGVPPAQSDNPYAWAVSFGAAMVPFLGFLYGHQRGATVRVINAVVHSPIGPAGLLLLPFGTLAMEKCVYDTVQSVQGIDPCVIANKKSRGGFPSGGAEALPSFSLVAVQKESWLRIPSRQ